MNHQGAIVEYIVRKNNYNISQLAKELGINRRSLYNWFGSARLKRQYIVEIGTLIRHDFREELPEVFEVPKFQASFDNKSQSFIGRCNVEENEWKAKYLSLLEKYNTLLTEVTSKPMQIIILMILIN